MNTLNKNRTEYYFINEIISNKKYNLFKKVKNLLMYFNEIEAVLHSDNYNLRN